MMSIAPQSISSNLRMMSDAQLAQYAKMHQNDPYIFPLAFQESQDRKALRSAEMAKQAGQMPPPVNQQDLAQMMPQRAPQGMPQAPQAPAPQGMPAPQQALPEEQGIGTLPAQNLQGMAGGGITGHHEIKSFKEDGLVNAYGYQPTTVGDQAIETKSIVDRTKELQDAAKAAAATENEQVKAQFDPFVQKFAEKQKRIDSQHANNIALAETMAGLAMMGGTSPIAFQNISKGGQQGIASYLSGEKAYEDSQDSLDHSQFLLTQAQDAATKGNVRDQFNFQNAAYAQLSAAQQHDLAAKSLQETSNFHGASINAEKAKNEILAQNAQTERMKAANEGDYRNKYIDYLNSTKPSASEKLSAQLESKLNSQTSETRKQIADMIGKGFAQPDAVNNLIDLHNQQVMNFYNSNPSLKGQTPPLLPYFNPAKPTETNWLGEPKTPVDPNAPRKNAFAYPAASVAQPGLPGLAGSSAATNPLAIPGITPQNASGVRFLGFEP